MSKSYFARLALIFACLVSLALGVCGCLDGNKTVTVVYNANADVFRFLFIYQHIRSDRPSFLHLSVAATQPESDTTTHVSEAAKTNARHIEAFEHLKSLYADRDRLMIIPFGSPGPWGSVLGESAFLRISHDTAENINLAFSQAIFPTDEGLPLEDIQIKPGTLFEPSDNNLCYYHQMVVPGKTLDAILGHCSTLTPETFAAATTSIETKISERGDSKPEMSWKDFTAMTIEKSERSIRGAPSSNERETPVPFETQSLKMIKQALVDKTLPAWKRNGIDVYVQIPMTEADVKGSISFFKQWRKAVLDELEKNTNPKMCDAMRALAGYLNALTVSAADATHLKIEADFMKLWDASYSPTHLPELQDADDQARAQRMAADAKANLDVRKLSIEQIVEDFKADKLAAYPPRQ